MGSGGRAVVLQEFEGLGFRLEALRLWGLIFSYLRLEFRASRSGCLGFKVSGP